eukprot:TRINITY_DN7949_c0_g1_i1.p2 TRINITY_DN7949_c0_g1~~TRINITY_DN7949_c0_g1_i1.p2  ORF type:complete len:328 (+),score=161.72 TRINITY_DN7949_c0_g1_i1:64-984(+)
MADQEKLDKEEKENLDYIRQHEMHHVFEKLAGDVLFFKPKTIVPFLIEVLKSMLSDEELEKLEKGDNRKKYDPTQEDRREVEGYKATGEIIKVTVAVFGIGNAGKSTLLSAMCGEIDTETTPTIGFKPLRTKTDKIELVLYDLGGGPKIRGVWPKYFADVHGIIYVVDAADKESLAESTECLNGILGDERTHDKPLLIFANKMDQPGTLTGEEVAAKLGAGAIANHNHVLECCALKADHPTHVNIDKGLEWLLESIEGKYGTLSKKVKEEVAIEKEKNKKRMEEQRERVRKERERREAEEAAAQQS